MPQMKRDVFRMLPFRELSALHVVQTHIYTYKMLESLKCGFDAMDVGALLANRPSSLASDDKTYTLNGHGRFTAVYFRLFITLVHISTSPVFASLSGNPEIASIALSTYSCASARVCCSPVLFFTMSLAYAVVSPAHTPALSRRTFCTSPSPPNFLPTNFPKLALSFHANSSGAVASPSSRSAPAGFPNSAPLIV
jgi:hypothetical protein